MAEWKAPSLPKPEPEAAYLHPWRCGAENRQCLIAELVHVAFTTLCERNYLLPNRSIGDVGPIQTLGRGARHFERNAHHQYRIGVEPVAVQELSDWHDPLPCSQAGTQMVSLPSAPGTRAAADDGT